MEFKALIYEENKICSTLLAKRVHNLFPECEVTEVNDTQTAKDLCGSGYQPHFIFLNPDTELKGIELYKWIRIQQGGNKETKIIAYTGRVTKHELIRLDELGFDGVITKPMTNDDDVLDAMIVGNGMFAREEPQIP